MTNQPKITICKTTPFTDQKPGTSGLRKKVGVFEQTNYVENFIQAFFSSMDNIEGKTIVVGGDGRYYNNTAIQKIIKLAVANNIGKILVGQNGIFSTPAVSCVIRKTNARGGIILTASHNAGGADKDFGIKFNNASGAPASETLTTRIFEQTKIITEYKICDCADIDLSTLGNTQIGKTLVCIIDPLRGYAKLLSTIFDFDKIKALFKNGLSMCDNSATTPDKQMPSSYSKLNTCGDITSALKLNKQKLAVNGGFSMRYDAMNAVTAPYAKHIFEKVLGAPNGTVLNANTLEDFGGLHPDPTPTNCSNLVSLMNSNDAPDLAAASDGDGDRNMILGRGVFISPCDSLAVIAANAHLIPQYKNGLLGVARSMPTSTAIDKVAQKLGIKCYEVPTGWKFFGNLMDAEALTICGEESFGTGSNHVREKDGIWAVLCWLNIIAEKQMPVKQILEEHWARFGRNYFARYDYENLDVAQADSIMDVLNKKLTSLRGAKLKAGEVVLADNYKYTDPIDHSISHNQGIRIVFNDGSRIIYRLSGTGTTGATLRVYLDKYQADYVNSNSADNSLLSLALSAIELAHIAQITGKHKPDNIV